MFVTPTHPLAQRAPRSLVGCALVLAASALAANSARAEQFTIVEASWTHDASAKDSHHYENPSAATPKNLVTPVDYSKGSVHVVLDVKTKPAGDTPTKFQVCFEGNPGYDCTAQSPTYTKVGQVVWSTDVTSDQFYKGNGGLDFTKPISRVALILKDTMNGKPSPDNVDAAVAAKYTPTDLHIEVVWVSAGSTYHAPTPVDAGARDAGAHDASAPDTSAAGDQDASIPIDTLAEADGSVATPVAALDGSLPSSTGKDAGVRVDAALTPDDPGRGDGMSGKDDSGCSASAASTPSAWSLSVLSVLALAWTRRRRQRAA